MRACVCVRACVRACLCVWCVYVSVFLKCERSYEIRNERQVKARTLERAGYGVRGWGGG